MAKMKLWSTIVGAGALAILYAATPASAKSESFKVALTGAQQSPPLKTAGSGEADLTYDRATREVTWSITYSGLASPATMAHFHRGKMGKNGPVVIWLSKKGASPSSPITGEVKLTPAQAREFVAGEWYVNVHTKNHPGGAIRGQVTPPKG